MKIVCLLSGKMRSGKNQFAIYLEDEFKKEGLTVKQDLFAKTVKDWSRKDFSPLIKYLNKETDIQTKKENWYEDKTKLTRILLQIYGTNIFRHRVDDNWWVKQQENRIKESKENVIIITDVRFPNEIDGLNLDPREYKIYSIRINRKIKDNQKITKEHESETALDDYDKFEYIICNDDGLEELKESAISLKEEILCQKK